MVNRFQLDFFEKCRREYGGDLLKTRKGRRSGRPISTQHSMHFVLRSTKAKGDWSFYRHRRAIETILEKFAVRNGVRILSAANVGNHIHMHLQFTTRHTYRRFIRAITSAIMMAVTGASRWKRIQLEGKFWDRRPFSRIVVGFKAALRLRDYVRINQLEAHGYTRNEARFLIAWDVAARGSPRK